MQSPEGYVFGLLLEFQWQLGHSSAIKYVGKVRKRGKSKELSRVSGE